MMQNLKLIPFRGIVSVLVSVGNKDISSESTITIVIARGCHFIKFGKEPG